MIRVIILTLCLAGSAPADVTTPIAVGSTSNAHPFLGIPRYHGGRQGDTLAIVSAQNGSNQTGWIVSYDRGTTWQDVRARWMAMNNGTATWYSSDHSAAWFAGGLHIVFRGYSNTDPAGYRYVAAPYSGEGNMEAADFPASGTDTYYPIVVANGANDVWFFDMSEGSGRDNLRYWHSTDRFATSVSPGRVCTITDDPQNYWRIGAIMGANGYPKVSVFKFTGGFAIWTYNPVTHNFDSALVVANTIGGLGRSYAQSEMNGLDHIVYTSGANGSLIHFYETSEGHFDSTIISKGTWDSYAPQLSVYGEGATARLYCVWVNRSSVACVKSWTLADGWDADSVVVSGSGHTANDPTMVPQVPSSWGFVPIWYHNSGNGSLYFVKIDAPVSSGDTIPPNKVNDLGFESATQSTVTLSWTAPGDDGSSGTAHQYDLRYSPATITTANWNSAASASGEPTPQAAGTEQTITVSGLNESTTYYFALKAVDESGNWSELSNVATGATTTDITPPAAIMDLGAVTGDEDGTIDLAWTATGDDGSSGTADSYAIRYSLSTITAGNWTSATVYPSPPDPKAAGLTEHLTLGGLTPAQTYFVAIRAVDNAGLQSSLSNVVSAEAFLDIGADVDDPSAVLPDRFDLRQNYPNPFNPVTTIEYSLARQSHVQLAIYDIQGRRVALVVDQVQPVGNHRIVWDARDVDGRPLASGVYFCRLATDEFVETTKMALVR